MYFNYLDGEPRTNAEVSPQTVNTEPARPGNIEPVRPESAEPAWPGNAEPVQLGNIEPVQPENAEPAWPENAESVQPGNIEPVESESAESAQPGNIEPVQSENIESVQFKNTESAQPESAGLAQPGSAAGRLELLERRVQQLQRECRENAFSEYLRQMRSRIIAQQYQINLLADELDRNYQKYLSALQGRQETGQRVVRQPSPQEVRIPAHLPERQKDNAEFTVGAAILSVVGSIFILIALALMGMHFMDGFAKGMGLYAVCIAVLLLAEFLIYPRWPRLGTTLSATGMGGLYLSTLVNYIALENFGMWTALVITFLITVGIIFLSRKRDAAVYRILGMAAAYICMLVSPMGRTMSDSLLSQTEFLVVTGMLLLINIMCLLVPVRKSHTAINVTHMALNTLFSLLVCFLWEDWSWESVSQMWHYPVFAAVSLLVMQLIFLSQIRWQERQKPGGSLADSMGICITYGISALFYLPMFAMVTDFANVILIGGSAKDVFLLHRLVCSVTVAVICAVPMIVLRERQEKWFAWYLLNLMALVIHFNAADPKEPVYCLAALLAAAKLLSFTKNTLTRVSDGILTAIACAALLAGHSNAYVIPLFIVLVLSVPCINYWKTYFAAVLTFTIALYTSLHMLAPLKLPVFVGILFVGLLLFNNVDRWRDGGILLYNGLVLAGQEICFLLLINPVYRNAYFTYLCMLVFGVTTIVICFQEKYHMDFKNKQMIMAVFLTYMALIVRTNYPVVNSILMMLIALVSVGMGFAGRKRSVRIYGLVLALVVCGKIVLYDFLEAPLLQRTLQFFIVGVLALVISAIYMVLERKENKDRKRTEAVQIPEERGAV